MIEQASANRQSTRPPRVSVVIPTHGHGPLILETLDSVFAQTFRDFEVIVVNDGSPDDTSSILAPLVADGRIRYVEQPNRGVSSARNAGIERALGEFVALLDDDDLWPADKLEWQVRFLDEHPDVGVVGGTLQLSVDGGPPAPRGRFHSEIDFESLFLGNPFWTPGQTLIRSALLKDLGGMNSTIWGADDWDLWFRVARVSRIVMVDRISVTYRLHEANASRQVARLLEGARTTLVTHLGVANRGDRPRLRRVAHRTLYDVFASKLVRAAGGEFRGGHIGRAMNSIRGVLPLIKSSGFERSLMADVARDFLGR